MSYSVDLENASALLKKGNELKQEGKLKEAIAAYRSCIEVNPKLAECYYSLGEVLSKLEEMDGAIAAYEKAVEINPLSARSYNNLGELFWKQGNLDRAVNCYRKAIGIEPEYYGFYHSLGEIFVKMGVLDKAARLFEKAAELYPKSDSHDGDYPAYYYYLLTRACWNRSQWEKAAENCSKALAINPNHWQYYKVLGQCFEKLEKWEEAIASYEKTIELNPADEEIYYWLGSIFQSLGKLESAIALYQQAKENFPKNIHLVYQVENLKAKQALCKTYYNLADILAKQGELEEAIKAYRSAINLDRGLLGNSEGLENVVICTCEEIDGVDVLEKIDNLKDRVYLIEIFPESKKYLELAKTVHENIHRKIVMFASMIEKPVFLAVIPEGRAAIDRHHKSVFSADNVLLKDVCFNNTNPSWFSETYHPLLKVDEIVYLLVSHNNNYFHWMFEVIAPLGLFKELGIEKHLPGKIAINKSELPFQLETLASLDISPEKIVDTKEFPNIKAKKLIVPKFGTERYAKWACKFLRQKILPKTTGERTRIERIYLSREKASYRRVLNEAKVLEFLQQFGFVSVTLESISVAEQALLLAGAKVTIAPHGAGLTNLVFCNPGTKVIEIFSPEWVKHQYYKISRCCN